ncbi:MAG: hypothetical protein EOM91_01355 [Sphingobacteriia bacterium]|nr:hypothetical protein [Sphingobacteriia bacterium]NCC40276.1 hypothetical protein [Gammaproteobacteria bacterium]
MNETVSEQTIPVFCLEIDREETAFQSVDAICGYFRARIEAHHAAVFIAEFDQLAHTRSLFEGYVGPGIRAAKSLVFCFGISLPEPRCLALRPRSIGVAETNQGFVVSFSEAPMPVVNAAMEDWARGLCMPSRVPAGPGQSAV